LENTFRNEDTLLRKAQALGSDIREMESIDVDAAWRETRSKIRDDRRRRLSVRLVRYAAMLAFPLLISTAVLGFMLLSGSREEARYAEVTASAGTVVKYELPDRSTVWLNAGSTLRFPAEFKGKRRCVELSGEAYFDVTADRDHPFYVNTAGGLSVYCYGTAFNVSAYNGDPCMETMLERGRINVITPEKTAVVMEPGDFLVYDRSGGKAVKNKADAYEKTAWKDGKLIFRNASIEDVMKRLERHFNVEIRLDNRSGKEYRYRATFRNETLPQILDYLARSADLRWETERAAVQTGDTLSRPEIRVSLY